MRNKEQKHRCTEHHGQDSICIWVFNSAISLEGKYSHRKDWNLGFKPQHINGPVVEPLASCYPFVSISFLDLKPGSLN